MGQLCGKCDVPQPQPQPEPEPEQRMLRPRRHRQDGHCYRSTNGSVYRWAEGFVPVAGPELPGASEPPARLPAAPGAAAAVLACAATAAHSAVCAALMAVPAASSPGDPGEEGAEDMASSERAAASPPPSAPGFPRAPLVSAPPRAPAAQRTPGEEGSDSGSSCSNASSRNTASSNPPAPSGAPSEAAARSAVLAAAPAGATAAAAACAAPAPVLPVTGTDPATPCAVGSGGEPRPALAEVTSQPPAGAKLTGRPPEVPTAAIAAFAAGTEVSAQTAVSPPPQLQQIKPAPPAPAPAPAPHSGYMEEDELAQCYGAAGSSSSGRNRNVPISGAGAQPCGAVLGDHAPASPRAARPSAVVHFEQWQPPAAERAPNAGRLDTGLLREDEELPENLYDIPPADFFDMPPRQAAAAINFAPAASRLAAAAPAAPAHGCALPARAPSSGSSSQGGRSVPALKYGPEGHLRASAGTVLTAGSGQQVKLLSHLGSGGFASVWRAVKPGSSDQFALKICKAGAKNNKNARREAATLRQAHERNPLRRHAVRVLKGLFSLEVDGQHGGPRVVHICIALPLMGADVADVLIAHGGRGVSPAVTKALVKQTLQGLAYLAAVGFAMSDLKPANLLLGPHCRAGTLSCNGVAGGNDLLRGRYLPPRPGESLEAVLMRQYPLTIGDLGGCVSARRHPRQRERQRLELTVPYRAPEVVTGAVAVSPAVGTWACACTCFELITGQLMFSPGQQESEGAADRVQWYQWYLTLGAPPDIYTLPGHFEYADYFFSADGRLRHCPRGRAASIWDRLRACSEKHGMEQDEVHQLAAFLHPMLEYDPAERATAQGALRHPWLII